MTTYVAFLRAINVTGRYVRMAALADAFRALGHAEVRTHINSGNVLFASTVRSVAKLQRTLEDGLEPLLGFRSEAFVRSAADVQAIAARAAELQAHAAAGADVYVCFLPAAPDAAQVQAVAALENEHDRFDVHGSEVYWFRPPDPAASRFSGALLERRLGLRSTLRRGQMLQGLVERL